MPHKSYEWKLRNRTLLLSGRTLVMGIVNVTPDSFSDGGQFGSAEAAIEHALRLLEEGAAILDIGGESTRPGSHPQVSAAEELRRVLPVIEGVLRARPDALVSVDTYKATTARAAVEAGAEIVNDVSGGLWDERMYNTVAELGCGYVLMHMRGTPATWRRLPELQPDEVIPLVMRELREHADSAMQQGVRRESIVLDPGFGFGKSFEENYPLLEHFEELHELGFPLLSGTSRKSFIGRMMARDGVDAVVADRLQGSVAAALTSAKKGAHIVRVHDVKETLEALRAVESARA